MDNNPFEKMMAGLSDPATVAILRRDKYGHVINILLKNSIPLTPTSAVLSYVEIHDRDVLSLNDVQIFAVQNILTALFPVVLDVQQ